MQYYDVIKNSRWWTAVILKIVILPYLGEKLYNFNKVCYTTADWQSRHQKWKYMVGEA